MDNEIKFEGLLEKESEIFKNKSHVWVVLDTTDLSFYRQRKRSSCIGSIKIVDIQSVGIVDQKTTQFEVRTDSKSYLFNAADGDLADTWVQEIQKAMNSSFRNPVQAQLLDNNQSTHSDNKTQENTMEMSGPTGQAVFGVKLRPSRKSVQSPVRKDNQFLFPGSTNSKRNTYDSHSKCLEKNSNNDRDKTDETEKSETEVPSLEKSIRGASRNIHAGPGLKVSAGDKPCTDSGCDLSINNEACRLSSVAVTGIDIKTEKLNINTRNNTEEIDNSRLVKKESVSSNVEKYLRNSTVYATLRGNSPECLEKENKCHGDIMDKPDPVVDKGNQMKQSEQEPKLQTEISVEKTTADAIELRTKTGHSDIDISGVEMRRSRRSNRNSNRNNSSNESWSRSIRSRGSSRDDPGAALPEIKIEATEADDLSDEVFDINHILGPLVKLGINGYDDQTNKSITWQSEACITLKNYLEKNSEDAFDLSNHMKTTDNSFEKLRNLLCN